MIVKSDNLNNIAPEFFTRHFKILVQQAVLALGKDAVRKIVDEA